MISFTERDAPNATRNRVGGGGPGRPAIRPSEYFRWKSALGRLMAVALLLPAAPMILLLVGLVRLGSQGPGIYRQVRVGRRGKLFTMYKIRTMRNDAESVTGPTWAKTDDERLTRLGKFIRGLHLDELPQLFNVIKGEMSLVGPRPERPEFTDKLTRGIDGYLNRLVVRPGITGLAQINLPPDTDLDSVRRKLVLDLDYIRQAGPGLDLRILCWTALRILGLKGSVTSQFLGLYREVKLPAPDDSQADEVFLPVPSLADAADSAIASSRNGNGHMHIGPTRERRSTTLKPR